MAWAKASWSACHVFIYKAIYEGRLRYVKD